MTTSFVTFPLPTRAVVKFIKRFPLTRESFMSSGCSDNFIHTLSGRVIGKFTLIISKMNFESLESFSVFPHKKT